MPKWPDDFSPVGPDGSTPSRRRKENFDAYHQGYQQGYQDGVRKGGAHPAAQEAAKPDEDSYNPTDAEVRAWLDRSEIDDGRIDHWRTVIDDARSMHLLVAAPAPAKAGEA